MRWLIGLVERSMEMKYNLIGIVFLLFTCSCSSLKRKKGVQLNRDTIHTEQQWLHEKTMLEQRKQEGYKAEKGEENEIEIFADDVFYWHPDSGLQSRKGKLKVRMRLKHSSQQLSLKHSDTTLVETTDSFAGETAYTSGSLVATEDILEKSKDLPGIGN